MFKMIAAATVLMISAGAMADHTPIQQMHFTCRTRANTAITVQEDAAGTVSLNRAEAERVPELGMTAISQKQILVANASDVSITSTDNGNAKIISMSFQGNNGNSQINLEIKKTLFGKVQLMTVSGTGAALARVQSMISSSEEGISIGGGCSIELP